MVEHRLAKARVASSNLVSRWKKEYNSGCALFLCETGKVRSCDGKFAERLDAFFMKHRNDAVLAGLLFDFLLDEAYSGSDCQKGAAYYIARLDKELLRNEKERRLFSVGR